MNEKNCDWGPPASNGTPMHPMRWEYHDPKHPIQQHSSALRDHMMRTPKKPGDKQWSYFLILGYHFQNEILGLIFVQAHRDPLYVESLKVLVPWCFALDHHNYSRWISVPIRDMESLYPCTSIHQEFKEYGHWAVKKTTNRFSSMPIDQAHEQNNELVKGSGGAMGQTENPSAFRKC